MGGEDILYGGKRMLTRFYLSIDLEFVLRGLYKEHKIGFTN